MTSQPVTGLPAGMKAEPSAHEQTLPADMQAGPTSHDQPVPAGLQAEPASHEQPAPAGMQAEPASPEQPVPAGLQAKAASHEQPAPAGMQAAPASHEQPAPAAPPLAGDPPAERHRLNPRVTRYWRWRAFFSAFPVLIFFAGLAYIIPWGPWWLRWGVVGILIATVAIGMVVLPPIRYRVFYYAISPTEIDIQHKIIFIERIVIPMHRVQSLRTERGPMADHYQMTNLKISTAGGSIKISGLDRREANDLCDRISELANIVDDV